jgi:hypothetical protein
VGGGGGGGGEGTGRGDRFGSRVEQNKRNFSHGCELSKLSRI